VEHLELIRAELRLVAVVVLLLLLHSAGVVVGVVDWD